MPYTPSYYRYVPRERIENKSLNVISNTFNTLQQRHDATIEGASKLKEAIAKLPLNPAEEGYRQELFNQVENALANDKEQGFVGFGYNDIVKVSGDISSDAGLIGRLNAQQEYLQYQNDIKNRKDLSELDKEYFLKNNPYHYEDKYDEYGNKLQGDAWTPSVYAHTRVPLNEILNQAVKWTAPDAGGGNSTRWLDVDGNITDDPSKAASAEYFSTTSSSWKSLSKDKLMQGIDAVIKSTPGAAESLHQEWEIAKWAAAEKGINDGIEKSDGTYLTEREYLAQKINPFLNSATYKHVDSKTTYNDSVLATRNAINNSLGYPKQGIYDRFIDTGAVASGLQVIKNEIPTIKSQEIIFSKNKIADYVGENIMSKLDFTKDIQYNKDLLNNIEDSYIKYNALNELNKIYNNQEYLDSILQGKSEKDKDNFNTYHAIVNKDILPDSETSKATKGYKDIMQYTWGKGKNQAAALEQYFDDENVLNRTIDILGKDKLNELGITIGNKNNKKYLRLDREHSENTYDLQYATQLALEEAKHNGLLRHIKAGITRTRGYQLKPVDENGNYLWDFNTVATIMPVGSIQDYRLRQHGVFDYVNKLAEKEGKVLGNNGELLIPTTTSGFTSPFQGQQWFNMQDDPSRRTDYEAYYKMATAMDKSALRSNIDLVQTSAYLYDDKSNKYTKIDTKTAKDLTAKLRAAKEDEVEVNCTLDAQGQYSPIVTLRSKDKNGNITPISFIVPNGITSETKDAWDRDTDTRAARDILQYTNANYKITLPFSDFRGQYYDNGFIISDNKTSEVFINQPQMKSLLSSAYALNDLQNALEAGIQVQSNSVIEIINNYINNLKNLGIDNPEYVFSNILGGLGLQISE